MKRAGKRRRWLLPIILAAVLAISGIFTALALYWGERLAYPLPEKYREMVEAVSAEMNVPESLIFAVMRTESGFRESVVSHAGAIGLMQVTPDAFSWIRHVMGWEDGLTSDDLTNPQVNIRYGTALLSIFLDEFGTQRETLAAYNAGRGRVNRWLADEAYSLDGVTLSEIPFEETRNYVERVGEAQRVYQRLYGLA